MLDGGAAAAAADASTNGTFKRFALEERPKSPELRFFACQKDKDSAAKRIAPATKRIAADEKSPRGCA